MFSGCLPRKGSTFSVGDFSGSSRLKHRGEVMRSLSQQSPKGYPVSHQIHPSLWLLSLFIRKWLLPQTWDTLNSLFKHKGVMGAGAVGLFVCHLFVQKKHSVWGVWHDTLIRCGHVLWPSSPFLFCQFTFRKGIICWSRNRLHISAAVSHSAPIQRQMHAAAFLNQATRISTQPPLWQ